jgi:amino acid permease
LALTGTGVFFITLVAALVGVIPCLGALLVFGAACTGLGAVALSRFGTTSYRRRSDAPPAEA